MEKIAVITGASSGIGLATAMLLEKKGWIVYALSRSGKSKQDNTVVSQRIIHLKADVNDKQTLDNALCQILSQHQQIDALVCNAGNGIAGAIEDTSAEEAKYQFQTTFFGVHNTICTFLPQMRQQKNGKIIIISSVAGFVPIPFQAFYAAAKSALLSYAKSLSMEIKPFGLQCCAILPGDTKTHFTSNRIIAERAKSPSSPYSITMERSVRKMEEDEKNGIAAEVIAQCIAKQIQQKRMAPVTVPCVQYKLIAFLLRLLPNKPALYLIGRLYA